MPEFHYKAAGTWRKAKELYYKEAGNWRKLKEVWYRSGGVWRKVFSAAGPVSLFDGEFIGYYRNAATSTAAVTFNTDGSLTANGDATQTDGVAPDVKWFDPVTPGIGSSYWIQANGGAWQQLSTSRTFSTSQNTTGISTVNYVINIAASSGGAVLASGTVTVEAEVL